MNEQKYYPCCDCGELTWGNYHVPKTSEIICLQCAKKRVKQELHDKYSYEI